MNTLQQFNRSLFVFTETWKYLGLSKQPDQDLTNLKSRWSDSILNHLNIKLEVVGNPSSISPLIFVGNHISYLDIVLVLKSCEKVSFLSKKEVSRWPVIGAAARKLDTTFIQRDDRSSRKQSRAEIEHSLLQMKKRIVVFPSGTTSLSVEKPWRTGIFKIANELKVPVQPFRISYSPLRPAAYIDEDQFFTHLMRLSALPKITAKIEFQEPVDIIYPTTECDRIQKWATDDN